MGVKNLQERMRKPEVSGTDTQSVVDDNTDTNETYWFLVWFEPYIQPRRSTTNLVVEEDATDDGNEDEAIPLDSCSTFCLLTALVLLSWHW